MAPVRQSSEDCRGAPTPSANCFSPWMRQALTPPAIPAMTADRSATLECLSHFLENITDSRADAAVFGIHTDQVRGARKRGRKHSRDQEVGSQRHLDSASGQPFRDRTKAQLVHRDRSVMTDVVEKLS